MGIVPAHELRFIVVSFWVRRGWGVWFLDTRRKGPAALSLVLYHRYSTSGVLRISTVFAKGFKLCSGGSGYFLEDRYARPCQWLLTPCTVRASHTVKSSQKCVHYVWLNAAVQCHLWSDEHNGGCIMVLAVPREGWNGRRPQRRRNKPKPLGKSVLQVSSVRVRLSLQRAKESSDTVFVGVKPGQMLLDLMMRMDKAHIKARH